MPGITDLGFLDDVVRPHTPSPVMPVTGGGGRHHTPAGGGVISAPPRDQESWMSRTTDRRTRGLTSALMGAACALALTGLAPTPAQAADSGTPDFGTNGKVFDPGPPGART